MWRGVYAGGEGVRSSSYSIFPCFSSSVWHLVWPAVGEVYTRAGTTFFQTPVASLPSRDSRDEYVVLGKAEDSSASSIQHFNLYNLLCSQLNVPSISICRKQLYGLRTTYLDETC